VPRIRPPRPAPRHVGFFADVPMPISPAFNEGDVADKPAFIRMLPLLDAGAVTAVTASYRDRLESLLAVDELVQRVVDALQTSDVLDDTVIVFSSDNGYLLGEHRVREQKLLHYGPSLRIAVVIRGAGFAPGAQSPTLVSNVDLGTTIARLTHVGHSSDRDGRRLDRIARAGACHRGTAVLLEGLAVSFDPSDERMNAVGVRTERYRYTEYATGERELYDLQEDPFELQSRHADTAPETVRVRASLADLLEKLRTCAGRACRPRARLTLRATYRDDGARIRLVGADRPLVRSVEFVIDGHARPPVSGSVSPARRTGRRARRMGSHHLWDGRTSVSRCPDARAAKNPDDGSHAAVRRRRATAVTAIAAVHSTRMPRPARNPGARYSNRTPCVPPGNGTAKYRPAAGYGATGAPSTSIRHPGVNVSRTSSNAGPCVTATSAARPAR
jgi:hypothetical protein